MPNLTERLLGIYGNKTSDTGENSSWIPKRKHFKDDLLGELRETVSQSGSLSAQETDKLISENLILTQAKEDIFSQVAFYLQSEYGDDGYETRLSHFNESWTRMYEKYGDQLILALAEITDDLESDPFVNFSGYLDKDKLREQIKSLSNRSKRLSWSQFF